MDLERCCDCDDETGQAGISEDSMYHDDGTGPYCSACYEEYPGRRIRELKAERDNALADNVDVHKFLADSIELNDRLTKRCEGAIYLLTICLHSYQIGNRISMDMLKTITDYLGKP